jgi:tagatose 1,6-diphosphate aldolase
MSALCWTVVVFEGFLDPGPLRDGELTLVAPHPRWLDAMVRAMVKDPLTDPTTARQRVIDFLQVAPGGHEPADPMLGRAPSYHFWMRLDPPADERFPIAGGLGLRIGNDRNLTHYIGHVGYSVVPRARGHHYAERAVRLLLPLARRHGMTELWITCNPDNIASRRTCERLGCRLIEIVPLPVTHPLFERGEREKCRYWLPL